MNRFLAKTLFATMATFIFLAGAGGRCPQTLAQSKVDMLAEAEKGTQEKTPAKHFSRPMFKSSIQLSEEQMKESQRAAREAMEQTLLQKLRPLAKISPAEAERAALQKHPGFHVRHISLRPIQRNLVYMVFLSGPKTERLLVIVDAGNGKILDQHQWKHPRQDQA